MNSFTAKLKSITKITFMILCFRRKLGCKKKRPLKPQGLPKKKKNEKKQQNKEV